MMKEGWLGLTALIIVLGVVAFGLMGTMGGCEGKAPVVHMCKSYDNEAACVADELCKWKAESPDKPAKCKAKAVE